MMQFGRDVVRFFRRAPNGFSTVDPHGWLCLTGEAGADLNMSFASEAGGPELVAEYVGAIRSRSLDGVLFSDEDASAAVAAASEAGLVEVGRIPLMERSAKARPSPSVRYEVRRATKAEVPLANAVNAHAFLTDEAVTQRIVSPEVLDDGVDIWLAAEGAEFVGVGAFVQSGEHVGVYMMSTLPSHQRRGVGRALLDTAIADYMDAGVTRFTLESTPAGLGLYERAGFETVERPTAFLVSSGG